ncbi:MAG: AAA family ATPase [Rhizobiales bacterium]|nr:AAA family ATPase [Hyphomicrobiales bacterium]
MLRSLNYSVTFPTGRTLKADVNFTTGLTGIIGANEAGKSMILEMVRYALWGTKALRGSAPDYKSLKVELIFDVKGQSYKVNRTGSSAKLFEIRGDEVDDLASGVKAVNSRIIAIFGYGLKVFDVANNCGQGEVEALSAMLPTQRKQMVDGVIGLDSLDRITEWLQAEAVALSREAEALLTSNPKPVEPTPLAGYVPSATLAPQIAVLRERKSELDQLRGFLSRPLVKPQQPVETVTTPSSELEVKLAEYEEVASTRRELERLIENTPVARYTEDDLDQMEKQRAAFCEYDAYRRDRESRGPTSDYTETDLEHFENRLDVYAEWDRDRKLLEQGHHTCPKCAHQWPVAEELADKIIPDALAVERSPLTRQDIINERKMLASWVGFIDLKLALVEKPALTEGQIATERSHLERQVERDRWVTQLEVMCLPDDPRTALATRRSFEAQMDAYLTQMVDYEQQQVAVETAQKRVMELSSVEENLAQLVEQLERSRTWEAQLSAFQTADKLYTEQMVKITSLQEEAGYYRKGVTAMKTLRGRVKEHLVPSLSRASSALLSSMTGGKRERIDIDDEFNVLVDQQAVNTLSGSGKAVANLAIRIGLGQVLTNKVFSVFMVDEIDAAMDEDRAGFTAECLRSLTTHIAQIIQVSHKDLEADTYIELNNGNGN